MIIEDLYQPAKPIHEIILFDDLERFKKLKKNKIILFFTNMDFYFDFNNYYDIKKNLDYPNFFNNGNSLTLLHFFFRNNSTKILSYIKETDIDFFKNLLSLVNYSNIEGDFPLDVCLKNNHYDMIKFILPELRKHWLPYKETDLYYNKFYWGKEFINIKNIVKSNMVEIEYKNEKLLNKIWDYSSFLHLLYKNDILHINNISEVDPKRIHKLYKSQNKSQNIFHILFSHSFILFKKNISQYYNQLFPINLIYEFMCDDNWTVNYINIKAINNDNSSYEDILMIFNKNKINNKIYKNDNRISVIEEIFNYNIEYSRYEDLLLKIVTYLDLELLENFPDKYKYLLINNDAVQYKIKQMEQWFSTYDERREIINKIKIILK